MLQENAPRKNGAVFRDGVSKLSDPRCFCMQLSPRGQRKTQDGKRGGEAAEEEAEKEGEESARNPTETRRRGGRVMQKEIIDRVFSLYIDSSVLKVKVERRRTNAVHSVAVISSWRTLLPSTLV